MWPFPPRVEPHSNKQLTVWDPDGERTEEIKFGRLVEVPPDRKDDPFCLYARIAALALHDSSKLQQL